MRSMQERLNLESMKDVLALAVRGASFDALTASLLQAACRVTGEATMATIYVVGAGEGVLELAAWIGMDDRLAAALARVPIGEQQGACGRAAHLREAVAAGRRRRRIRAPAPPVRGRAVDDPRPGLCVRPRAPLRLR
jgi:hypothetical protein